MTTKTFTSKGIFTILMVVTIMLQVIAAFYFCTQKQGFHYDENYSYYSSNVTAGLAPTDGEWMDSNEISDEFMVTDGMGYSYGMVVLMQTFDVHPPLYYLVLHTVCSLTPGVFSKWQGLSVNLFFFILSIIMLWAIADIVGRKNKYVTFFTTAIFGFSPAVLSGVTFVRMYMMLTFWCLLSLYIHIRNLSRKRTFLNCYFPIFLTTFLGFMTHYYFVVFLFFMAAYMTIVLFAKKETRKDSFLYAGSVLAGMILTVAIYPSCLSHIFRGYRGTEAIGAFFDLGNLIERASLFVGLLDEYLFCKTFYPIILILVLLFLTYWYMKKRGTIEDLSEYKNPEISLCIVVTVGYFLVVLKTALLNAEEAVRYELPSYGLIILLIVIAVIMLIEAVGTKRSLRIRKAVTIMILSVVIAAEAYSLFNQNVLFLYPEDAENEQWALERSDKSVVYIYNYENSWMIWDSAHELEQYDRIYYINMDNQDMITDADICSSDEIIVYAARDERSMQIIDRILESNSHISDIEKVRELLYADVFVLK